MCIEKFRCVKGFRIMFCISKIIDKHKNNEEALSIPFDYIFNFQDRYDVYGLNIRENEEQILTDDSLHYLSLKKQIQGVDRHIITVSDEVLISFMKSIEYYKSVFVRINTDEFSRGLFITDYQDFYFYRNNGDKE